MGRGVLQGTYAYDLCTCVQRGSLNVACPEESSFRFRSKCILCPTCLVHVSSHGPVFQTALVESTQPDLLGQTSTSSQQ